MGLTVYAEYKVSHSNKVRRWAHSRVHEFLVLFVTCMLGSIWFGLLIEAKLKLQIYSFVFKTYSFFEITTLSRPKCKFCALHSDLIAQIKIDRTYIQMTLAENAHLVSRSSRRNHN